jgi:energy-coupling factor transporter ATP-binding protein EcfA2
VGLELRADTRICDLSGGQLKRACVANEIVHRPSLLFLDEATSGLDEQTDAEMMRLFRRIADGGKTVVCVTHNLANVEETCHRVVVLAEGGKMAFVGTPAETRQYFRVDKLGAIYEVLKTRAPEEWRDQFLRTKEYQGVRDGGSPQGLQTAVSAEPPQSAPMAEILLRIVRQAGLLSGRYLQILWADRRALLMMLGQCLLVAFLVVVMFGDVSGEELPQRASKSASIMFLLAISSVWFGCNNAAREIVKEKAIYVRERDVNLQTTAYVVSKFAVLCGISFLQVFLLSGGCGDDWWFADIGHFEHIGYGNCNCAAGAGASDCTGGSHREGRRVCGMAGAGRNCPVLGLWRTDFVLSDRPVGVAGLCRLGLLGAAGCGCIALCGVFAGDECRAVGFRASECGSGELAGVVVAQHQVLDSSVVEHLVRGLAGILKDWSV